MVSTTFALSSSALWGTADFLGGRATRTWGALRVLFWSQLATLILVWLAIGVTSVVGAVHLDGRALLIGGAGGISGVIGLAAFYRALAIGPMAVVPPIAAAGVVIPVAVGLVAGEPPTTGVIIGLLAAIVGVVLASVGESAESIGGSDAARRISPRTFALCILAALGFAGIFVALDAAAGTTPSQALVAVGGVRIGSVIAVTTGVLVMRVRPRHGVGPRAALGFAGIGVLDTTANLLFAVATAFGELEIVAVLGSLYPAVTSALAHVVLGERLGRLQLVGVAVALAGVAALAGAR